MSYDSSLNFIKYLTNISKILIKCQEEDRKPCLKQHLFQLNNNLPSTAYLPLSSSNSIK